MDEVKQGLHQMTMAIYKEKLKVSSDFYAKQAVIKVLLKELESFTYSDEEHLQRQLKAPIISYAITEIEIILSRLHKDYRTNPAVEEDIIGLTRALKYLQRRG